MDKSAMMTSRLLLEERERQLRRVVEEANQLIMEVDRRIGELQKLTSDYRRRISTIFDSYNFIRSHEVPAEAQVITGRSN